MAYECQNFKDGQVLTAKCLNRMEKGIEDACKGVKTVNGVAPDENGNVAVQGGSGGIAVETDPTVPAWAKQPEKPTYTAEEVGAIPASTAIPTVPTKVSAFENDSGYLTSVPAEYAKKEDIPKNPADIGAQPEGDYAMRNDIPSVPVQSVNGKTGSVQLSASDVKARPDTWMPTAQEVGALPSTYTPPNQTAEQVGADLKGTAANAVSEHNTADSAHGDIRLLITGLTNRLNALANSTDTDLDQLAELVAYIKNNKSLIDGITTSKVSVSDIVNNLSTNASTKPLSAAQGVALKALIDAITVPTKLSQLSNDAGFITGYTESDPTVPAWAKNATKPSYSKSEVGLGNVDNVKQYSASNPPPYPVTSVNGKTGAVNLDASAVGARPSTWMPSASDVGALPASTTIPTKISQLANDKGYLTQHQDISGKVDKAGLTLGRHADGLLYVFVDGQPVGDGVDLPAGGIDGYITPDKQIVFNNLPDGEYTLAYINDDGSIVPIGAMEKDTNVYYTVTNTLTQCTTNNSANEAVQGGSYSATITAKSGYELSSIVVKMGGTDISSTAVSGGTITIANVTGNIVITAVATEVQTSGYTNLADPTSSDWLTDQRLATSYGTSKACTGMIFTNFIPATAGDVLRVKGLNLHGTAPDGTNASVCRYNSSKTYATNGKFQYTSVKSSTSNEGAKEQVSVNGDVYTYTILLKGDGTQLATSETAYIRISAPLTDGYTAADVIITINEPIE